MFRCPKREFGGLLELERPVAVGVHFDVANTVVGERRLAPVVAGLVDGMLVELTTHERYLTESSTPRSGPLRSRLGRHQSRHL